VTDRGDTDIARERFLTHQSEVYNQFKTFMKFGGAMRRSADLDDCASGYVLAMQFDTALTDVTVGQNARLSNIVDCVRYDKTNIHTTITEYDRRKGPHREVDLPRAAELAEIARVSFMRHTPTIDFREWLFNDSAVILAGYPDQEFTNAVSSLLQAAKERGLNLRWPWGAHITVGRFCKSSTSTQIYNEIKSTLQSAPTPGRTRPSALVVGYFEFRKCCYKIDSLKTLTWQV
jgi:hypothetical protein